MRLIADESVDGPTVERLRAEGHSVLFVAETTPGIADYEVLAIACREEPLDLSALDCRIPLADLYDGVFDE